MAELWDHMKDPRAENGVKVRRDGQGDGWAEAHRGLGCGYNMQDMDGYFGFMAFGANTGNRVFLEYVPDDFSNRNKAVRSFGVVAIFDRKFTNEAAFSPASPSKSFYLWLCRIIGRHQTIEPRFFFVIGSDDPPWQMIEIDTHTGETLRDDIFIHDTTNKGWKLIWDEIGLSALRAAVNGHMSAVSG